MLRQQVEAVSPGELPAAERRGPQNECGNNCQPLESGGGEEVTVLDAALARAQRQPCGPGWIVSGLPTPRHTGESQQLARVYAGSHRQSASPCRS